MSTPIAPQPRHRATRRPAQRGGRRVAERARPRYGRIAAVFGAVLVTAVSVGAGMAPEEPQGKIRLSAADAGTAGAVARATGEIVLPGPKKADTDLPADSGDGKRVVFDQSDQRVWLVDEADKVERTYLVSGSLTDNLDPGTYAVYSRSRWAVGIDDSGVMQYFVRFTRGANAAIGFHTIPFKDGQALQTTDQLGTPQSHGCIRQDTPDAVALWDFAPEGTTVVVTA